MGISAGTGRSARSVGVEKYTSGDLEAWGGIVSGHVADWVEALGTTPERFLAACDDVDVLVDTSEAKGFSKGRSKEQDRTDDPALRCVAMTADAAEAVADRLD